MARGRLNAAADRTRGAWPQSMRARAEKIKVIAPEVYVRSCTRFLETKGSELGLADLGPASRALVKELF